MIVRAVAADAVRPLRAAVLRPGQTPDELVYPSDAVPGALHAGAYDEDAVVGIVSISPDPHPTDPQQGDWRVRGMAVDPVCQGRGVGAALLRFALDHARACGGRRVWCNARVGAVGFYETFGMRTEGAQFTLPHGGPHFLMSGVL